MFTHDLSFNEDGTEVDGVSLKTVSDRFRMHNLSLAENMFSFSKLENQAALFRAHLYGDGEYRDDSVQIEFALNSKFDGFNMTRELGIMFLNDTSGVMTGLQLTGLRATKKRFRNFRQQDNVPIYINLTLETLQDEPPSAYVNTLLPSPQNLKMRMMIAADDLPAIQIDLQHQSVSELVMKTTYYATFLFLALAAGCTASIKLLMEIARTPAIAN